MLTTLPIPNGVRLVAATTYAAVCYHWRLYRDQHMVRESKGHNPFDTVVIFDLTGPMVQGKYWVEVISETVGQ